MTSRPWPRRPRARTSSSRPAGSPIDGASSSENKYIIDGIETNDPETGLSSQQLVTDMVDEVQVKSSGYEAEYSGAVGGVVNVVTKSGTNDFKGSAWTYYSSDELGFSRGPAFGAGTAPGPGLRGRPPEPAPEPDQLQRRRAHHLSRGRRHGVGARLRSRRPAEEGQGLVLRQLQPDPAHRSTARSCSPATAGRSARPRTGRPTTSPRTSPRSSATRCARGWPSTATRRSVEGNLRHAGRHRQPGHDFDVTTTSPNWSGSCNLDYIISPKFFISGRAGYFNQDVQQRGRLRG